MSGTDEPPTPAQPTTCLSNATCALLHRKSLTSLSDSHAGLQHVHGCSTYQLLRRGGHSVQVMCQTAEGGGTCSWVINNFKIHFSPITSLTRSRLVRSAACCTGRAAPMRPHGECAHAQAFDSDAVTRRRICCCLLVVVRFCTLGLHTDCPLPIPQRHIPTPQPHPAPAPHPTAASHPTTPPLHPTPPAAPRGQAVTSP